MMEAMRYPLTSDDILVADSILRKVFKDKILRGAKDEEQGNILLVSDFSHFDKLWSNFHKIVGLNKAEYALIKRVLAIDPNKFGVPGKKIGVHAVPKNMVRIPPHRYMHQGEQRVTWTQYVTKPAYLAFQKMNHAMHKELGTGMHIFSGYRSPAYQLNAFLRQWQLCGYRFLSVIRLVTLPGYSEHCDPKHQAMDIRFDNGIPDDMDNYAKTVRVMTKSKEYQWMLKNAKQFGFALSYRPKNTTGIKFEPWHWRYIG